MIKRFETELLASDLSSSTVPPPFPHEPVTDSKIPVLFPKRTLLQVINLDAVSHAAHGLHETLKDKREARRHGESEAAKDTRGLRTDREQTVGTQSVSAGPGAGEDALEEEKVGEYPATGKGMMRFTLSDGHQAFVAMEYRSLGEWCGLDELQLGAKVSEIKFHYPLCTADSEPATQMVVQQIRQVRGVLLLEPSNTTFKGGQVGELHSAKEWTLENTFRKRLG